MPRFRFTVRRLMVAVAIIGVALGTLAERHARFRRLAAYHAARGGGLVNGLPRSDEAIWRLDLDAWHARLAEKYQRAANRPWEPLGPDPPRPEIEVGAVDRLYRELESIGFWSDQSTKVFSQAESGSK